MQATHLEVETVGDIYVARVQSRFLGPENDVEFADELSRIDDGSRKIVLNLSKVRLISAAVLGKLIFAAMKRQGRAPQLRVSNLIDDVRDIFDILDLDKMFTLCIDEQEAIESLREHEPCPDCGGTGKYIGFRVVEPCLTCDGNGSVPCL